MITDKRKTKMEALCVALNALFLLILVIDGREKEVKVSYEFDEDRYNEYIHCHIGQGKYKTNVTGDSITAAVEEVIRDVVIKL